MLEPMAAPARSAGLAWPDIVVSKKVMSDIVTWVTRIGNRMVRNCMYFCFRFRVSFIRHGSISLNQDPGNFPGSCRLVMFRSIYELIGFKSVRFDLI
ncbi:hypothetical protein D1872_279350 [compost metagenome]